MFIPNEIEEFTENEIKHIPFEPLKNHKIGNYEYKLLNLLIDQLTSYNWKNEENIHTNILYTLVRGIVKMTNSKYGCICMFKHGCDTLLSEYFYKKSRKEEKPHGKVTQMKHTSSNLFIRSFEARNCIISNDVQQDPRLGKVPCPENHMHISTFLAIPVLTKDESNSVGQLVLVNSIDGYSINTIQTLFPLLRIIINVMKNYSDAYPIQSLDTLKHHFIATMSHEIRTPLSGIVGMISILHDAGPLNDRQKEYLNRALGCCIQLMDIITDILDYSKMQSGTLVLNEEPFELNKCIQEAIDVINPRIFEKKLEFINNTSNIKSLKVYGDHKRLRQVFVNLLSNAVKYTKQGTVSIQSKIEFDNNNECSITFYIRDTGIGILKTDIKKIFKVFTQLKQPEDMSVQGTGLGLAITKELLKLMRSTIKVKSNGENQGTVFYFTITFNKELKSCSLNSTIKILVVEDDLNNRIIISNHLHSWNVDYTICSSSTEALNYLHLGKKFDVCIIDVCMSHISGIELAQKIKKEYPQIPLIALSSGDVGERGQMWFDVFLMKPYNKNKLYFHIMECVNKKYLSSSSSNEDEKRTDNTKICIVEDDETNRFVIAEFLKSLHVPEENIYTAINGKDAIDICKTHKIDMCLMDLLMPVMDGFEASKEIKKFKNPPTIVVISASILDTDRQKCSKIGVDGYLTKPIKKEDLQNVLDHYILKKNK